MSKRTMFRVSVRAARAWERASPAGIFEVIRCTVEQKAVTHKSWDRQMPLSTLPPAGPAGVFIGGSVSRVKYSVK